MSDGARWSAPGEAELRIDDCLVKIACSPVDAAGALPSLWLLDVGDAWAMTVAAHRLAAVRPDATAIAPGAVIGVMPIAALDGRYGRNNLLGGESRVGFIRSLIEQVIPRVERQWQLDAAARTVAGHSLAGRLALEIALAHSAFWHGAAAISPSLWHRSGELETLVDGATDIELLLTVGEHEGGLAPWEVAEPGAAVTLERRRDRAMVRQMEEFATLARNSGIAAATMVVVGADHATVQSASLTPLLRFAFPAR